MLKEIHILSPYDSQQRLICCLVLQPHGGMQILVKMPVGLTATLDMDASDAVHYVKTSCWSPDALFHKFSGQKDFTHHLVLRNGWQVFVKPLKSTAPSDCFHFECQRCVNPACAGTAFQWGILLHRCPTKSCFQGVLRLHVCIHAATVHPRLQERVWFQTNHMGCCFEACLSLPLEEYAQSC